MKQYAQITFYLFLISSLFNDVLTQNSFSKINDFGHVAIYPFALYEKNNVFYSKGINIKTFDLNDSRYNFFIAKQSFNGDSLNFSFVPQEEEIFATNLSNTLIEHQNKLYSVASTKGKSYLFSYDLLSSEITKEFELSGVDTVYIGQDIITLQNELFVLTNEIENNTYKPLITKGLKTNTERIRIAINENIISRNLLNLNNSTLMIVGNSYNFNDSSLKLIEIDTNGNIINEYSEPSGLPLTGFVQDVIYTIDSTFVISSLELDPTDNDWARPYVYEIDKLGNKKWEKRLGDHQFLPFHSTYSRVLESIENDGYIFAGNAWYYFEEPDSLINLAHLVKLDKEGEELWFRSFSYIEGNGTRHLIEDMVKTSDGGYALIGSIQCGQVLQDGTSADINTQSGTPCRRSLLIKVNSQGLIDSTSLSISMPNNDIGFINVYPNPISDVMFIETDLKKDSKILLFSSIGQLVQELQTFKQQHTFIMDTSLLDKGIYTIIIVTEDGKRLAKSLVKI